MVELKVQPPARTAAGEVRMLLLFTEAWNCAGGTRAAAPGEVGGTAVFRALGMEELLVACGQRCHLPQGGGCTRSSSSTMQWFLCNDLGASPGSWSHHGWEHPWALQPFSQLCWVWSGCPSSEVLPPSCLCSTLWPFLPCSQHWPVPLQPQAPLEGSGTDASSHGRAESSRWNACRQSRTWASRRD